MFYNLKEGYPFPEVRDKIILATRDQADFTTSLHGLADAYQGGREIAHADGQYVLTTEGFKQFADRIGLGVRAIETFNDAPDIQQAMVRHLAHRNDDSGLLVRTNAQEVQAVLSDQYVPIRNFDIAIAMDSILPEGARAHRWDLGHGGRALDMRVLVPSWVFNIGNGHKDTALAGIHITNNELGGGQVSIRAALSKVSCFNYTLAAHPVFESAHRYTNFGEFHDALNDSVKHVNEFAQQIADQLRSFRKTPIEDVVLAFSKVGERLGVPQYALDQAQAYWEETGRSHSLFDVVQAITHGTKALTDDTGRRAIRWDVRNRLETEMLELAQEIKEHGEEHLHTCLACGHVLEEAA